MSTTKRKPNLWLEPQWRVDPKTGERWQARMCGGCYTREKVNEIAPPSADKTEAR